MRSLLKGFLNTINLQKLKFVTVVFTLFVTHHAYASKLITLLTPPLPGQFYFESAYEVLSASGFDVTVEEQSFPIIYKKMINKSKDDKEYFATVTIKNKQNLDIYFEAGDLYSIKMSFFTLKSNKNEIKNIEDAKKFKSVCVWLNSYVHNELIKLDFKNIVPLPTLKECVEKLRTKKVDAFLATDAILINNAKELSYSTKIFKKNFSPFSVTFFLALSKNTPQNLALDIKNSASTFVHSELYDKLLKRNEKNMYLSKE